MLLQWEDEDADVRKLWETMNSWAINGLMETYERMGIAFDHYQYESNTYVFGKDLITQGLKDKVFYKEEDGSVWVNNEDIGLDKKIVLRNDGTSVYITQDIGTVYKETTTGFDKLLYVVCLNSISLSNTL